MIVAGAGASVYHGVSLLLHPQPLESLPIAMLILSATGVLEGYTLSVAWSEVKAEASKWHMRPLEYLNQTTDPLNPAGELSASAILLMR